MSINNSNTITKTIANLIKNLSPRNRDVISRRFGLKSGKKETLESIGRGYGITRERVRQIEEFTLRQLAKAAEGNGEVKRYISFAESALSKNGGVMKERSLFKEFSGQEQDSVANSSLVFILSLNKNSVRISENDDFHSFWAINSQGLNLFKNTSKHLNDLLKKSQKSFSENDFYTAAKRNNVPSFNGEDLSQGHLNAYLTINKSADKNIFNEVGLVSWSEIKPKGVRDKAYLVLKRESSPKHFSEIAGLINGTGFGGRKANVQTVHNELIKDNRFVLVGRGMYALSQWGYKAGTVKDVLVDILKSSLKPLDKSALLTKVMNARMVKENTVLLNLQDSKTFVKNQDGTYSLRKA